MPATAEHLIESPMDCAQEVLQAYTTLMHGMARPRGAFDQAVRIYHSHNPGLPNDAARRAVANIICHKP